MIDNVPCCLIKVAELVIVGRVQVLSTQNVESLLQHLKLICSVSSLNGHGLGANLNHTP